MIPIHLKLSGFLSYRDPVELDFTAFHLACISGSNGAGKSSLLDAITWALFGQARKRDESLINLQSKVAEVAFTFSYEDNVYRVLRSLPRGKTTLLEFQIRDDGRQSMEGGATPVIWRPLTERTARDTQARIEHILRLDYETFINVSFFLQGRADQFAQQPPSRRKEILGSILGLETWEGYRDSAAERRKAVEHDLSQLDGRMQEISIELAEEPQRRARLVDLSAELDRLTAQRKMQAEVVAGVRQARASLDQQAELVRKLGAALDRARTTLEGLEIRRDTKEAERAGYADILARSAAVESAYAAWQKARQDLEGWDVVASQFHEQERFRQPFLDEINTEKVKLDQERKALDSQRSEISAQSLEQKTLEEQLTTLRLNVGEAARKIEQRTTLDSGLNSCREQMAGLRATNVGLKIEMDELKLRIEKLEAAGGAACPLCGQPLSPEHRRSTLEGLQAEGELKAATFRENRSTLEELATQVAEFEAQLTATASLPQDLLRLTETVARLGAHLAALQKKAEEWGQDGAVRLALVERSLADAKYAAPARKSLAKVDKDLAALGYAAAAHDAARQAETQARQAEAEFRELELARSAFRPLEDEVANLNSQVSTQRSEVNDQEKEHGEALAALSAVQASAPDLAAAQEILFTVQEQENRLNQDVGAARQKVSVLDGLRERQVQMTAGREEFALQVGRYKTLEHAFGKDGVPALLIEQALPQIESKANELLDRLSDGTMSVRFITQSAYKAKKRDDLKETLDIQISDGAGGRDYELYSGGEAFRVNFAIRLALSEVLASRKGARLQMLVIDEGFGSQDDQGRQRLIQSINAVQDDFAKILVITHLDELKDAFPTRIEVEKMSEGSVVTVS